MAVTRGAGVASISIGETSASATAACGMAAAIAYGWRRAICKINKR